MQTPFTVMDFFEILREYNLGVYPMHWVLLGLAVVVVGLQLTRGGARHRLSVLILGFFWVWMALVFHLKYFTIINPAAKLFAALFIVQAVLLVWKGVVRKELRFGYPGGPRFYAGMILILYALAAYPLLGRFFGHQFPASPTFGLPCPTTIFTVGIFYLLLVPFPRLVLIVPIIWSAIGSAAVFQYAVYEDLGLLAAGVAAIVLLFVPQKRGGAV